MAVDDEMKLRILTLTRDRMMQAGYSKVTLDELAEELGISKKTLYKYFSGKEELALEAVRFNVREIESAFNNIADSALPFSEKINGMMQLIRARIGRVSTVAIQDMRRHAPQLWAEIERMRRERILKKLEIMIRQAREERVFRPDVDERVLVRMMLASVDAVANPAAQEELSLPMQDIMQAIFHILFDGALTDEARMQTFARSDAGHRRHQ